MKLRLSKKILGFSTLSIFLLLLIIFGDHNSVISNNDDYKKEFDYQDALDYKFTDADIKQFHTEIDEMVNSGINIQDIPSDNLTKDKLIEGEYNRVFYFDKNIKRKVIFNRSWIEYLQFSESKDMLGFYYEHNDFPKAWQDTSLVIMDIPSGNFKEIYSGDYRTSEWEWFDDNHVLVHYNCGTECNALYKININTGKKIDLSKNFGYGVGYKWSPDKKFLIGYHYTASYGIVVGNSEKYCFNCYVTRIRI